VNTRGAAAGWVGETDARTETATSKLREVVPTMGELYAYPHATEWALDDVFFDVGAWLAEEAAQAFAVLEGAAVLTGDGTSKPTGMLNTTPVETPDHDSPLRAAAAYEFMKTGSTSAITADQLVDLFYRLNAAYRPNATWIMNSATAGYIRKLKDEVTGTYLWQPSLIAGQPEMLLGRPVETWEQMDSIGSNNFPVAFGDFRRGYLLADRVGLRITVDASITTPGMTKFFIRRREGGQVLNNDAIKWIRTAT
jgi:HK97 family phage major capsid protein